MGSGPGASAQHPRAHPLRKVPVTNFVPRSEGSDVTVVAVGHVAHDALAVADKLEREGFSLEYLIRELLPLDRELLAVSVVKTGRIAIFDDFNRTSRC